MTKIPPIDLTQEFRDMETEAIAAIRRVLASGKYILGEDVEAFEAEFAQYIGSKFAVGVNSGTDALLLSLLAAGIGEGDEVITTPLTYAATTNAIVRAGAKPVFLDIDEETFNINPILIKKAISKHTKAILPVHLYGLACDMDAICKMAKSDRLIVIEDCAQACGAELNGKKTGSFGNFGAFSFYPTKTLGADGDGGAVVTNSEKAAALLKTLRSQGDPNKSYRHTHVGVNSRLDTLQAAILRIKLKKLDEWNRQRREAAHRYDSLIQKAGLSEIILPKQFKNRPHTFHQYTIRIKKRDELQKFLREQGIPVNIYYPIPMHQQPCYKNLKIKNSKLPVTEKLCREILSLPIYPQIQADHQRYVVDQLAAFFSSVGQV